MPAPPLVRLISVPLMLLCAAAAHASEDGNTPGWTASVSVGAGVLSNPIAYRDDIPLFLIPHISYRSKRLFLDDLEAGVILHETDTQTISIVASPGYDGAFFHRNELQNIFVGTSQTAAAAPADVQPTRSPGATVLVGPELTFRFDEVSGQLDLLHDVTRRSNGFEVRGAVRVPITDAHGSLAVSAGFTWKSASVVDYYYGTNETYPPGSAFNPFLKIGYSLPLTANWQFTAFARYEKLAHSISDSPIATKSYVEAVFVGWKYSL